MLYVILSYAKYLIKYSRVSKAKQSLHVHFEFYDSEYFSDQLPAKNSNFQYFVINCLYDNDQ